MRWSAVTWCSASPAQQEPEHRWYGGEAVQPVFSWTLSGAAGGFVGRQPVTRTVALWQLST